jgi:hypothetical protein
VEGEGASLTMKPTALSFTPLISSKTSTDTPISVSAQSLSASSTQRSVPAPMETIARRLESHFDAHRKNAFVFTRLGPGPASLQQGPDK